MIGFRRVTRTARGRTAVVLVAAVALSSTAIGAVATLATSAAPAAAAPANHGAIAYVVRSDGVIQRIDTATNKKIGAPIGSDVNANDIAISPDGATAYLPDPTISGVMTLDTHSNSFGSLSGYPGGSPLAVAASADGSKVLVTDDEDETLRVIDTSDNSIQSVDLGGTPNGVAVTPDGHTAYVSVETEGTHVAEVDLTGESPSETNDFYIPEGAAGIAITPDGAHVYAASYWGETVTDIATADDSTTSIPLPDGVNPQAVAITPDGGTAYVTGAGSGFVYPINTVSDTVGNAINVGGYPSSLAITPDGHSLYVGAQSNAEERGFHPLDNTTTSEQQPFVSGRIVVVDTADNSVVTKLTLAGHDPYEVAIAPDQAPVARLAVAPGPVGQPSDFDASASTSVSTPITNYAWDFGDGNTDDTATPTAQHTYASTGNYTATVTETDAAGTSTDQVFTGKTISRNGGPSATTSRTITVVTCDANDPCDGTVSEGNQNVDIKGTSSTDATLSISIGVATVSCGDGDAAKPREVVGLDPENFTASNLQVTFTFVGQSTLRKIPICYSSTKPFRTFGGKFVTTGLVPHCHTDPPESLPCLASVQLQGDNETETVFVPATDPKFWAKQKVQVG